MLKQAISVFIFSYFIRLNTRLGCGEKQILTGFAFSDITLAILLSTGEMMLNISATPIHFSDS